MTPLDEIRTAAEKLRATCPPASPGPWTIAKIPPYTDPLVMSRLDEAPADGDVLIVGSVDVGPADQAVMQMLHPGVGLALAPLLDAVVSNAVENDHEECRSYCTAETCDVSAALAVARALNKT